MSDTTMQHKTFDLEGANCTSCKIGIEHMGRRLKGVEDIFVDRENSTIELDFDGNPETVNKIVEFVERIGYEATPRE